MEAVSQIQSILIVLLLLILCGVFIRVFQLISLKITRMKLDQIMDTYVLANNTVKEIVHLAVVSTKNSYVTPLKETGQFNDHSKNYAFQSAKKIVKELVNPRLLTCYEPNILDVDTWLGLLIEDSVNKLS